MNTLEFTENGDLAIRPSEFSSQHDFDFLVGKWNIHNKKLTSRLSHSTEWIQFDAVQEMRKVLIGLGNVESIAATINDQPFEGMAVRLFNTATKLWSIYWADNSSGTLDKLVVGSFDKGIGIFYGKEIFNGQEIILQFNWDITNPDKPVWSQAISPDNGKTWEWNWYMYFTRRTIAESHYPKANQNIQVIELRNYLMKPGRRDEFINYFEENFILAQNELGSYTLGQYRIKDADDHFFWIRGFKDMPARDKFLNDFYHGPFWQSHKAMPNSLLLNNDNVHLLKPLDVKDHLTDAAPGFNVDWFRKEKGIAVVDFYTANTKLDKLIEFVKKKYFAILGDASVVNTSFWVSEPGLNEFTALPVFQDQNLLVQFTFYKDECDYHHKTKTVESKMSDEEKTEMADLVTFKNTLIIYPTDKSCLVQHE